ncbi:leukocyte cell-derived chemotaxin 1-like [Anguilla anguilla]|uniref:leukocyte cell-derived chemotaxin 1-like n=1 Tax=Anguilla anguilla TaxID=7936 RepID=UPI0015AE2092|nr:leukocyte cell-derived chemotaxin 1-like [Anguilla anguilla]
MNPSIFFLRDRFSQAGNITHCVSTTHFPHVCGEVQKVNKWTALARSLHEAMAGTSEKIPIAMAGPEDVEQSMPPAYTAVTVKPSNSGRLLKIGAVVLIAGAALLLFGAVGAFYFWKVNDKNVYNVHYSMSINGKVEEGSMEIDARNNLERFRTGSGDEEAVEVHDFHIGITGIRFSGGEKCYIKTQPKAHLPEVETLNKESMVFDLEDEIMPVKFDEESLIWVAGDQPLKDSSFLSAKILDLCRDLPIFWLRPAYPKDGRRKRRDILRAKRQSQPRSYDMQTFEEAAEERNTISRGLDTTAKRATEEDDNDNGDDDDDEEEEEEEEDRTYNPENPYHRNAEGEEGTMVFDPMLDHQGICCTECRRSHTHCQRICEPLGGYWPWPYDYRGCRVACRVIMPCRWWVARILGIV